MTKPTLFILLLFILVMPSVSAAHFITGFVNDSLSGEPANGKVITLWNPAIGVTDNLTDVIGPDGNSGADNIYLIDCELLTNGCSVGDVLNAKVYDNRSKHATEIANVTVGGVGFDVMSELRLNSVPNVTLYSPVNFANVSTDLNNFSCTAEDLDANLVNITLYGDWGGWHANETLSISGGDESVNYSKTLTEGTYLWNCLVKDNISISSFDDENFTFHVDLTSPNVSFIDYNLTEPSCGISSNVRVNCTVSDAFTGIETVIIEAIKPSGRTNHSAQLLTGDTYYSDILLNETGDWTFNCFGIDYSGNHANLTNLDIETVYSSTAELSVLSDDIILSDPDPPENFPVVINATVFNNGCADADSTLFGFYDGDPDDNGIQINGNRTASVPARGNVSVNVTWFAEIGTHNIFVEADVNDVFSEDNETNNVANKSIIVRGWQEFYGNVTLDRTLADQNIRNLSLWYNDTSLTGNIFMADTESDINWVSLSAIGKNSSGDNTTNDFSDIDDLLNMTNFSDSVSNEFTTDGSTPRLTEGFFVHQFNITQVPIINSTNNTNFSTGILWDTSDDSNGEFDTIDKEDILFVAKVSKATQGTFGIYDYEIRIPVRLREYYAADSSDVYIYFDLN